MRLALAVFLLIAPSACSSSTAPLPEPASPGCTSKAGTCVLCSDEKWRCEGRDDAGIGSCATDSCTASQSCVYCTGGSGVFCHAPIVNPGGDNDIEVTNAAVSCSQ